MADSPKCLYCGEQASQLKYYTKLYPSGKDTIENPILCCSECSEQARQDLSIHRGGIEGIKTITFRELARMKEKHIGRMCSKRGYELNHLANKIWRSLIFQIHYKNQPSKKEILKDSLGWYQGTLEDRMTNDFDRRLFGLLDCVHVIQEDLK